MLVANLTRRNFVRDSLADCYCGMEDAVAGDYVKFEEAMEASSNSLQQLKAEIADKKVESNQVCDYCVRSVGAKVACSFSVQDFSCFRGRQLSAV
jgi:hypothetical protein